MGEGVASLGSGKPVGSGNRQGGAGSLWASACAALVPALGLALPATGASPGPTCPELNPPSQGDTRTNLPWVHHSGLRQLVGTVRSVSIQPRVQLQVTQGEGQPPTHPPGQLHPSRAPLGVPGADPPRCPCGSSWPQCPSGHCPANAKGVVRVGRGTGLWCVTRVWVGVPHLATFVCQVPALLQLAEEEDGPSRATGRQWLLADLHLCTGHGHFGGTHSTKRRASSQPQWASGWDKSPQNLTPGEVLKTS